MQDKTLEYYENNAATLAARYESVDRRFIQTELLSIFSGKDRILEIGCGAGHDAAFMISRGLEVVGCDGSRAMLREAECAHPELKGRLKCVKLPMKLPFNGGSFDGAFSIAALMHLTITDISGVIRDIHRVLTIGGVFFFSVSLERDDVDGCDNLDSNGRLFTPLCSGKWSRLCTRAGFTELYFKKNSDTAGREIVWGNFLYRK